MRRDAHTEDAAVRHVVATLPDSIKQRRDVLVVLSRGLAADYPHRAWIAQMIDDCNRAERDQLKFLAVLTHTGDGEVKKGDL